jgi:hypothetical protein
VFSNQRHDSPVAHTAEERDRITVEISYVVLTSVPLAIGAILVGAVVQSWFGAAGWHALGLSTLGALGAFVLGRAVWLLRPTKTP